MAYFFSTPHDKFKQYATQTINYAPFIKPLYLPLLLFPQTNSTTTIITPTHGALLVIGSDPGIGTHTASLFVARGFAHILLLSRSASRLQTDAAAVQAAAPSATVDTIAADVSSTASLNVALTEVEAKLAQRGLPLETVFFNAARVGESKVLDFPVEALEEDFRIAVSALYGTAQWALPRLLAFHSTKPSTQTHQHPSLIVTGGFLHRNPHPPLFSLSVVKAAQHNLVSTLYKTYARAGVHCAMLLVGGFVSPDARVCNPRNIAEKAWELYAQDPGAWEKED